MLFSIIKVLESSSTSPKYAAYQLCIFNKRVLFMHFTLNNNMTGDWLFYGLVPHPPLPTLALKK